ncbi:methyltransferase domain-containing protein [Rhizobium sp. 007]|uniref:class I SAM-dependent methyltransferase n=1 Tax=Rhizobium sp. 007 TaxID=2785056 RepID=UPI0018907927|nr:methyltransferase domain-containing protein [Rhizobium sp. 007]QPB18738.1 methyltransferase domain-containing protein [Rhizobium sp. 007]
MTADAVQLKKNQILAQPEETARVVERASREIVKSKRSKRFFDDSYAFNYSKFELDRRPFLNIGPGSFRHPYWRTADKKYGGQAWTEARRGVQQAPVDYYWDVYSGEPLPERDKFFSVIYTSHVIEHLFPQDTRLLFSEAKRVLKEGGIIRVVCPDAALMVRAYQDEDWAYFLHYLDVKSSRLSKSIHSLSAIELREISAQFLIDWVSLIVHPDNPTRLAKAECPAFLTRYDNIYQALDAACALSDRETNKTAGAHVNWFTFEKLESILKEAGFTDIRRSGYLQSTAPILRDSLHFDRTDPEMSLFVEARA